MTRALPIGIAAAGLVLAFARRAHARLEGPRTPVADRGAAQGSMPSPEIRSLIEHEANAQGVPPSVALAFAELESGFNPRAFGDRDWASCTPKQWNELRTRMPNNPAIDDPSAWGSYGLFGLLAAYHVRPDEHPNVLRDPNVNASRGVRAIRRALERVGGNVANARLLYVGCGQDGSFCAPEYAAGVVSRLRAALQRWNVAPATTLQGYRDHQ